MSERWVGESSSPDVEAFGRWQFIWVRLLDADPVDAAEDLPTLRVFDRVKEQTVMGVSNARIDSYSHPEAATVLEIDGWAPAAARTDDDHFRRLVAQGFDVLKINGQQRLKHRSLSLSQRPPVHANDRPIGDGDQHSVIAAKRCPWSRSLGSESSWLPLLALQWRKHRVAVRERTSLQPESGLKPVKSKSGVTPPADEGQAVALAGLRSEKSNK
ncbi:hypothetical protein J5X84_28400 [Streptosporangiaceae bacterium NEAU-GS5]|nr:hypothetical protein [Streptosporangiaceae bacterium NEAU-GS5]